MALVARHKKGSGNLSAQMTIEFVVCFPVLMAVALIGINAVLFFGECAAFDRCFRNAACSYAASPGFSQTIEGLCAEVKSSVEDTCSTEYVDVSVDSSGTDGGIVVFTGTLSFTPTLFGMGTITEAFGVKFPKLTHSNSLAVNCYQPGTVL